MLIMLLILMLMILQTDRVQKLLHGNRCVHTPLSHPLTHMFILFAHFSELWCLQDAVKVMGDDQEGICSIRI